MRSQGSNRTNPLALFPIIFFMAMGSIFVTGCNSPNSAPNSGTGSTSTTGLSATSYAGALSVADSLRKALGDTLCTPSPFLYPASYLQQQLALTDSQTAAIQHIQDSMKLAFRSALQQARASGITNKDSIRALVQQFKTALQNAITPILTPTELVSLLALAPPYGEGSGLGGGRGHGGPDLDTGMRTPPPVHVGIPAGNDSVVLAMLTQKLSLTNSQVVAVKALQDSLAADTALTLDGRQDAFSYDLTLLLTPAQLALLGPGNHQQGLGDMRRGRHR